MSIYNDALKVVKSSEKRIINIIKESIRITKAEIVDLYKNYSTDGVLDIQEMQKYSRLVKLNDKLKSIVVNMYKKNSKVFKDSTEYTLQDTYYKLLEEVKFDLIQKGIDVDQFDFATLNTKTIDQYIQSPISGKTLNKIISDNQYQSVSKLQRTITSGIVRGDSIDKIVSNMQSYFQGQEWEARRIARTETLRQMSNGRLEALSELENNGVKLKKIWLTTIDGREREDHFEMNDVEADDEGNFYPGGYKTKAPRLTGVASQDINCRCDIVTEIDIYGLNLKTFKKDDTEYKDWLEKNNKEVYKKQKEKLPNGVL